MLHDVFIVEVQKVIFFIMYQTKPIECYKNKIVFKSLLNIKI